MTLDEPEALARSSPRRSCRVGGRMAIGRIGPAHAEAAGRLAAALGEEALADAVDTLRALSAALDQIQSAPVMTSRTSGS